MDRDPRNGTDLKRLPDSAIARMSSTVRSSFRVPLFQAIIKLTPSQLLIQMVSPLQCKSEARATLRLDLVPSGGPTETAKVPRNGTVSKRLLVSAQPKKILKRKSGSRATSFQLSMVETLHQNPTPWVSPSFKEVSDYFFEFISDRFVIEYK